MVWQGKVKGQNYPKNLISFLSGDIPLKSRHEIITWCIASSGDLCLLITPKAAWDKVDFETSMYSQRYSIPVVTMCLSINTVNPALMPASVPLEKAIELKELGDIFATYPVISPDLKNAIPSIFAGARLLEVEAGAPVGVMLRRVGKDVEKNDLFTRLPDGEAIDIFHTCLSDDEPKPYSAREMGALKLKGMAHWMERLALEAKPMEPAQIVQQTLGCPNCGSPVVSGQRFCGACGARL